MSSTARTGKAIALQRFVAGRNTTEIAEELGVDRITVWRWRREPEFAEELANIQQQILSDVHDQVLASALKSIGVIVEIRDDEKQSGFTRLRAAVAILELLGRHKGSPVSPVVLEGEIETEEQLTEALSQIPEDVLRREVERRATERASRPARRRKPKVKDL